jgi:predicted Zn-dependent peptidase
MRNILPLCCLALLLVASSCNNKQQPTATNYQYEEVANDPLKAKIYTLKNGLKVYLTVNKKEPRIQTYIPVKAGSKNDPANTTGLAHYLEHMLFKGSSKIGTKNWASEKVLLDKISALYEAHLKEQDPAKKKAIYKQIDSLSYEASKFAIPNEYDKIISGLGAKGTNAYTSVEQTVYINDIPSNELEKWLMIESERFRELVLRLFHTELETVYEEFNRGQDNDFNRSYEAFYKALFPTHPYGTQTTIGKGEHLKNPSMVNIHNYFNQYYVPNNMAICLSGDLDPDKTIALIEKYFGGFENKQVPEFKFQPQPEFTQPVVQEVYGVQPEHLFIGFRLNGANSKDALMIELINGLLSNGQAGLIDLNIMQKQKVLNAEAYTDIMADYSVHGFYGEPRQGQKMEEVSALLLAQLDSIKQGKFDDWLLEAVIKNQKLQQINSYENNRSRAFAFVNAFTLNKPWKEVVTTFDEMNKITKADVMKFASEKYNNNYVAIYKKNGQPKDVLKVDKPEITPVVLNRDDKSEFLLKVDSVKSERLTPVFVDYQKEISTSKVKDVEYSYIKNDFNELFELNYILNMGSDHDKKLAIAIKYLPYLGTDKYSAEALQKEFFRLGLSFDVYSSRDKSYITLKGLDESFEEGIKLFEHILSSVQADEQAYADMVDGLLKERSDAKLDKGTILFNAMNSYGKYGATSPFTNIISEKELKAQKTNELIEKIKNITSYKHRIFYYGPSASEKIKSIIEKHHAVKQPLKDYPVETFYTELEMKENKVYFVNYDMVQTELMMLSKGQLYNKELAPSISLFNEYFGSGLSSIVFQEIREAKALAYSAYSSFSNPRRKTESHYVSAYIGTQANKLKDAVDAMQNLMNNMPEAEGQFNAAKDAALKKIESERIVGASIFWNYEALKDRGLNYDIRKDVYEKVPAIQMANLKTFFEENIKGKKYTYLVLGNKNSVDKKVLQTLGRYEELSLQKVFNY